METTGLDQQDHKANRAVQKIRRAFALFFVFAAAILMSYAIYCNAQRTIVTIQTGERLSVKLRLPNEFMDQTLQDGVLSESRAYIHRQKLKFSLFKFSAT